MCTVSMVGDHYTQKLPQQYPIVDWEAIKRQTDTFAAVAELKAKVAALEMQGDEQKREIAALRKEVQDMKDLLQRAHQYDIDNNEPHCEMEDKVVLLKRLAAALDVDLGSVFEDPNAGS